MAYFRRYKDRWQAQLEKHGIRDSATFDTKNEAQAWARKRESEIDEGAGRKVARKSLHDALNKYIKDVAPHRNGARWEAVRCARFKREFVPDCPLKDFTTAMVAEWRDKMRLTKKDASVRRDMEVLRTVFEVARTEWKWVSANPVAEAKKPRKPPSRTRTIAPGEVKKILDKLGYSQDGKIATKRQEAALCLLIALETGMRASEILRAEIKGKIAHLAKTKNGDSRDVPLSVKARALYKRVPNGFTLTAATLDVSFRWARDNSGLHDFTFHDSRANFCTATAKKVDVLTLARIPGHRDIRSLMIYFRESADEIADKLG